jgi:hypothetical protein
MLFTREENTCAKTGSWSFLARSSSGQLWALFLPQSGAKEPDAVQAVRDWLEKTLEEFSKQWPKAKKQARSIQDDLVAQAQGVSKKLHFWSR